MKRALVVLLLIGCKGTIIGPGASSQDPSMGGGVTGPGQRGPGGAGPIIVSQAPVCSTGPKGRSYASLDGHALEQDRLNVDIGVDTARLPTSGQLIETQRGALGQDLYGLGLYTTNFTEAFGQQEALDVRGWYQPTVPGISLAWTFFYSSYRACFEAVTNPAIYMPPAAWRAAPSAQSAPEQCRRWMLNFWWDAPSDDEVAACADFALNEVPSLVHTPGQQWAYVCASIMSSAPGIAY